MAKLPIAGVLYLLCGLLTGPAFAQEAYLSQVGVNNTGANVALGSGNAQRLIQFGRSNAGMQVTQGLGNVSNTVQAGELNSSLIVNTGQGNSANAVQLGIANESIIGISGLRNTVSTIQTGAYHRSSIRMIGNDATITVGQDGVGRKLNLSVNDQMSTQPGASGAVQPFRIGVIQGRNDAPVSASISRTANGSIVIR